MNILHFPFADDGCTHYRIKLPLMEMERQGAKLYEVKPSNPDNELMDAVKAADVLFLRASDTGVYKLIEMAKEANPKLAVITDIDDDLFDVTPLNNSYQNVGQHEIKNSDGTFIWKHGEKGFDLRRNWHWLVDYRWTLRLSDVVTTTSQHLKERLEEHTDVVAVMPNAVHLSDFPAISTPHKTVRIVWSGGSSHFEDMMLVKPAIEKLMNTYPQVELHIAGQKFGAFMKGLPETRVFFHPWIHPTGHGFRMATLNADIGIAPLVNNTFNHAKSSIKFYEYSALGLATVASNTAPYADDVVDGVTGVLADPQHFYEALEDLVNDPLKRATLARNAREYVERERTMETIAKDWLELFEAAAKSAKEANA